ncbi:MAG: TROVE domain-containing protein [Neisseriaceae bacterium]|nr:MAG: TROVE domain-containing protein [Neisseriaceae bacterium]
MAAINKNKEKLPNILLAGGAGNVSANNSNEMLLRRAVSACMLWEDNAYIDGVSVAKNIADLIPKVDAKIVSDLAIEARFVQKLRHIPLFICREMARHPEHKKLLADTLEKVIHRADELCEFLALYWNDNDGKKSIPKQVKKGLAKAFVKFNEYELAKYNKKNKEIKLSDVLNLCHAKPKDQQQSDLWKRLFKDELKTPDTWEVGLSACKSAEEKKAVWERLIQENKLGATAFLKNLRNMTDSKVNPSVIREGLKNINKNMLVPLDFLKAEKYAPDYSREIEAAMLACASTFKKLPGKTILIVDVSGSMGSQLSRNSEFNRMDTAASMAVLAAELCENVSIYATAGSDSRRIHQTSKVRPYRGFALSKEILSQASKLGGGGIFTKQCLEFIQKEETEVPDRIIVFSDSQDCDNDKSLPKPFGKYNYIVDISSESRGINYNGVWSAEISGWSEGFLKFISESEI